MNRADSSGQFWKTIGKSLEKFFNAAVGALKIEFGMGKGFGHSGKVGSLEYNATAYKESFTIGFDDGELYTATTGKVSFGVEASDNCKIGVEGSFSHPYETNFYCECGSQSSVSELCNCPYAEVEPLDFIFSSFTFSPESYSVGYSRSKHIGIGYHFEISWDVVQFWSLLFEEE